MATAKGRAAPVGSAQWITSEREQAAQFVEQEVEEFGFSVRNDFEWLIEHFAGVFDAENVNLADIFKTPGKLRGKTPRTARKRDGLAPRQPLTDIFAPSTNTQIAPPSVQKGNAFYDKVARFQIAEDEQEDAARPTSRSKSPQRVGKPGNTDSGYHGMTEDEMDVDARTETATASSQQSEGRKVPLRENQARPQAVRMDTQEGGQASDESFMSAREEMESRNASREQLREEEEEGGMVEVLEDEMDVEEREVAETPAASTAEDDGAEPMDEDEPPQSPSDDASSPDKPLQRKSSFTFSALPAREPLTAKRSIGARNSQVDAGRNSVLARSFGAKGAGVGQDEDDAYAQQKAEETKAHNKTSTQLLHERITMLGKTKEPRTSKSIHQSVLGAGYPKLPAAEAEDEEETETAPKAAVGTVDDGDEAEDDDDDWIAPSKPAAAVAGKSAAPGGSPARHGMHQKSISTTNIPSPTRPAMPTGHQKATSVSNPSFMNAAGTIQSTTPVGSPMGKKHHEGPLSASKNKLWSALKSAKSIFASSASASAAAKLEAHNSPSVHRSPKRDFSDESKTAAVYNMPGAMYSERQLPQSPSKAASIISASPSRKTRSSSESDKKREKEREKEHKALQKAADELGRAREKERQKAAKQQEEKRKAEEAEAAKLEKARQKAAAQPERPVSADADKADMPPPQQHKSMLPAGKLRAPGRLVKPTRVEPPSRPAPVSIRVASQSQRLGQVPQSSSSALSKSQHESSASMAPPPPPKTGLRTTSAQGNVRSSSTAPTNARVRALEAAARKKEADEKAAAKKLEQKRELERKRAAKAEEERRVEEERKAAEVARVQEVKMQAQRKAEQQAQEARRREQLRLEQQRQQEEAQKARAAHELAEAIKRERAQQAPAHQRGDVGGTLRQLAGKNTVPESGGGRAGNGAKPPPTTKRVFQPEEDEVLVLHQPPLQRPGMQRAAPSYQQNDAKRRRTNEEQEQQPVAERHSVMAPPKRPSNMRKESTLTNKFPHGYTHAPPPAAHHATTAASMFKSTVTAQHQLQHAGGKPMMMPSHPSQTVQMSSARIPFAENVNPPAAHHAQYQQQQAYGGHENVQPGGGAAGAGGKFKTPARPAQAPKHAKSSPLYPNGDQIQLPEIQTDSEDEDDSDSEDTGFRAPSWVASPALKELLSQQQLVDPETVFGPIGELKMEEVFKGSKAERVKKFRDRGSSAAWVESGDAVTSAEKRRDMEARERVVREGGWRYEPSR